MKKTEVKEGDRYGRLTIIKEVEPIKRKRYNERRVLCRCDCGNEKVVSLYPLLNGKIVSCGCYRKECSTEHGKGFRKYKNDVLTKKLHSIWHGIKCRCYTHSASNFKRYGGRGIIVCDEWLKNFDSFYIWAINNGYSDGLTIDRIDYNGIYEPSNCRWVDYITQGNNRSTK